MHRAIEAGDLDRATAHVDFRYRVAEMLGSLFTDAPEHDQAKAVDLARQMFIDTTHTQWPANFAGRPATTREVRHTAPHVWVESAAQGDDRPDFTWSYRLTRRPEGWRVTQREFRAGPARSDTSAFYPQAVRHLGQTLGRQPTLDELNANLPSLVGRLRTRTITIPELPTEARP